MRKSLFIAIPLILSFCGIRGNPTPPRRITIPKPSIKFWQMGRNLVLFPGLAEKNPEGEKIHYKEIKLWMAGKKAKMLLWKGKPARKISVRIPANFIDQSVRLIMEIRAKKAKKALIKTRFFVPRYPPLPPTDLKYEIKEEGILLSWKPQERDERGKKVVPVGYIVFKNGKMGKPIFTPFYLDSNLQNGKEYKYRVSSLLKTSPPLIMSEKSQQLKIVYRDTIPPSPPPKLEALVSGADVFLQWEKSPSPDVEGYVILRDGKEISPLVKGTDYWDRKVEKGKHSYRVLAVDRAGNRSQPSPVAKVEVR